MQHSEDPSPSTIDQPNPDANPDAVRRVLLTGATGYVGGRLAPRLLEAGYAVRCFVRSPRKLDDLPWSRHANVEIVRGDASDEESVVEALDGCDAAYYLIHSMIAAGSRYADRDRTLAETFAAAAKKAELPRILYLGGLGETGDGLSEHLRSRREVESALASTGVPVTVLRAAMIIGSGSASFEILRYLVERLPVMITPRWVSTECQPVAIRNVLDLLVGCLAEPETAGRTFDIGAPEIVRYRDMIQMMAEALELPRRIILPIPLLTPRLSSLWIHMVTPLSKEIARPLAEGLRNRVVRRDYEIEKLVPVRWLGVREAIELAIGRVAAGTVETSWRDAGPLPGDPDWAGGTTFVDKRDVEIDAPPARVFWAVCRIGGGNGWYAADSLWRLRGLMDQMVGGPGLRRGRNDPERLGYGDALDFWRVTHITRDQHLGLRAEMKVPGEAFLEFTLEPLPGGRTRLVQTAKFQPRGLLGLLYWFAVLPFHSIVFSGMLRGMKAAAESEVEGRPVEVEETPGLAS